jgi:hypothetical protein
VTFTATGGTTYEFFVDGTSQGAASSTATFTSSTLTDGQVVTVEVTNANNCSATSSGITMTVNALPTPGISSNATSNTICGGRVSDLHCNGRYDLRVLRGWNFTRSGIKHCDVHFVDLDRWSGGDG